MKQVVIKEFKLVMIPGLWFYALLSALLLIPAYPSSVGVMYGGIAVMIAFSISKTNKDIEFSTLLPIRRADVVIGKHVTVAAFELLQLLVAIPFALISLFIISPQGNQIGLDPNFTFFGVTLLAFSVFNVIFLPGFFKTGHKLALPAILASAMYVVTIIAFETLIALVPSLQRIFDGSAYLGAQFGFLVVALLVYGATLYISYRISCRYFEKVNL